MKYFSTFILKGVSQGLTTFLVGLLALLRLTAQAAPTESPSLEFVENRGQWAGPARYGAALPGGGQLFAEVGGLRLALLEKGALDHPAHASDASRPAEAGPLVRGHAFDLHWVQANPAATLSAHQLTPEHRNYLRGSDPAHWARDVRSYRELRYADLWPGVEARFYENDAQRLEYDLELAPGADPTAIGLRHEGATAALDAAGNLLLGTSVGTVRELAPQAWQLDPGTGRRRPVACRYHLDAAGVVRFALGNYDHTRPLTIDPTLVFATYTGSTANNWGFTAAYDAAGNLYSGGIAFSLGYPASPGAFQTTFGGMVDMAFIKYNVTQTGAAARVWATYVGGGEGDYPHSLVVNAQNELLVLGSTGSANFPTTTGAVQRTFGGGTAAYPFGQGLSVLNLPNGSDMVVCRLAADGTALLASTYLGGNQNDGLLPDNPGGYSLPFNYGDRFRGDIQVDAAGNVFLASCTASANFPLAAAGASFQRTYQGGASDALVCKLDASLGRLLWGGYLGGSEADAAYSLQVAPGTGDVYVAGGTLSPNLSPTAGALHPAALGTVDGFVARLAAGGNSVQRVSYLGTSAPDQAYFVQLGTDGGVYVLGQTQGTYPTTPGLYTNAGGRQFIHKLTADLSGTLLATVFGSGERVPDISPTAFLVDHCDRVFVCGWGGGNNSGHTTGLPVTPGALQAQTDGSDFYLAQFTAGLTGLGYATFYGASGQTEHVDGGTSRFDPRGVVYQAVCSCFAGTGFPILPGANYYATTNNYGSGCNNAAFVLNFQPDVAGVGPPLTVCQAATLPLVGTPAGGVWSGPGVSGGPATGYLFTPPGLGTYALTYTTTTGTCGSSATRQVTVVPPPAAASIDATLQPAYCLAANTAVPAVPLTGTPAGGTFSGPGVRPNSTNTGQEFDPSQVVGTTATIAYTFGVGCPVQATRNVTVFRLQAGSLLAVCVTSGPLTLRPDTGPAGGTWTGPGVTGSVAAGFVFTPSPATLGTNLLTYTVQANGVTCSSTRQITVAATPGAASIGAALQSAYCLAASAPVVLVPLTGTPAGGTFSGTGVQPNATGTGQVFNPSLVAGSTTIAYTVPGACSTQATRAVTVSRVDAGAAQTVCATDAPLRLLAPSGQVGTWTGPGVTGSAAAGYIFTPSPALLGVNELTFSQQNSSAACSDIRRVTVAGPGIITLTPLPGSLCRTDNTRYPLAASPGGGVWQGPGVSVSAGTYYFTPAAAGAGTFALSYTAIAVAAGTTCSATQALSVTVSSPVVPAVPADTLLCPGTRPVVALRGSPAGGTWAGPGVSGSLATGFTFTPPATWGGSASLVYTFASAGNCVSTATRRIGTAPVPAWQPSAAPAGCPGDVQLPLTVRFADAAGNAATRWDFGDGSPAQAGATVLHTYQQVGRYQPRASLRYATDRCELTTQLAPVEVVNVPLPNIITPNGDALNQTFRLPPTGCTPRLQLFSRWGQLVFEDAAYHDTWDAAGHAAGLYYYLLTYPDGHTVKGWLEVAK